MGRYSILQYVVEKTNLNQVHEQYLQSIDECGVKEAELHQLEELAKSKQLEHDTLHKQHLEYQKQLSQLRIKHDKLLASHQQIKSEMESIEREIALAQQQISFDMMQQDDDEAEEPIVQQPPKKVTFKPQSTITSKKRVATNPNDENPVPPLRRDTALFQHFSAKARKK